MVLRAALALEQAVIGQHHLQEPYIHLVASDMKAKDVLELAFDMEIVASCWVEIGPDQILAIVDNCRRICVKSLHPGGRDIGGIRLATELYQVVPQLRALLRGSLRRHGPSLLLEELVEVRRGGLTGCTPPAF